MQNTQKRRNVSRNSGNVKGKDSKNKLNKKDENANVSDNKSSKFGIKNIMIGYFKFYKEKLNSLKYEPNITHFKLAELEKKGKIKAIITQNIDGLHQKAGSQNVLELHGSVLRNYCMKCGKFYNAECVFGSKGVPRCTCGGVIKPDVVLYEEALNDEILNKSISAIRNADLMIVAGTSLTVYPASGLINFYNGPKLIVINREKTQYNRKGNLVINESLGKIFKEI